jgi:hypothetical protein
VTSTLPLYLAISSQDVMSSDALRAAVEAVTPSLVNFRLRIGQSKPIYNALSTLKSSADLWQQLSPEEQRLVSRTLTEMAGNGVGLNAEKRAAFNEIKNKLEQLGNQFSNNVLDAKGVSVSMFFFVKNSIWPLQGTAISSRSIEPAAIAAAPAMQLLFAPLHTMQVPYADVLQALDSS